MAMLRSSRALDSRFLIACVGAIALSVCATAAEPPAAEKTAAPPRTLMRLPTWIESLGERSARKSQQPVQPAQESAQEPASAVSQIAATLTGGWKELTDDQNHSDVEQASGVDADPAAAKPATTTKPAKTTKPTAAVADAPAAAAEPAVAERAAVAEEPAVAEKPASPAKLRPTTSIAPPVAASPSEAPALAIDPASFRGVYPGKTTRDEIESAWGGGEAFTREDGTGGLFWKIEPFERVEVMLDDDIVDSIRIKLVEPVPVKQLAEQLEIADLRTVSILDEQGVSIGEVFPERGVVISVKPGTQSAVAVLLEPLDAEAFVLRADGEIDESSGHAVADLQCAVQIDPKHARAQRLLLVLLSEQGCWLDALAVAEAAERIDPDDVWTRLKHASVLLALGRTDAARAKVEGVKAQENIPPLVTAQTARMLGRIELEEQSPDHQKSVSHFEEAIRTATPLLTSASASIQGAARDVLLDAHLGTALAIARGTWQQKGRVIPKWISRSETLVSESKKTGREREQLEMQLCRGALAAAAGSAEGVEPLPWVKRLLEAREKLGADIEDLARRRQIDWEVGRGLADALAASLLRNDASDMLDNATLTAAYLESGSAQRQLSAVERREMGDLLFRIGILHSLQKGDHATAVTWFDKVVPLWDGDQGPDEAGRIGESLVSMAISYWQVNRRADALKISRQGVELMVEAVDRKELDERSLAVAYGNLSTMHAEEGDDEQSKNYAEMASRAEATGTTLR